MTAINDRHNQRHVIIAGVNKCGTTSLFRYLSDHPAVRPSIVKEPGFFLDYVTPIEEQTYRNYETKFQPVSASHEIALEASPAYFTAGRSVAERIHALLPDARFIVMLREPADRLYSYFRSAKNYDNYATKILEGYDFDRFVAEAEDAMESSDDSPQAVEFRRAIGQGCYAKHVKTFHSIIAPDSVHYIFFEDFCSNPVEVVRATCDFLHLPSEIFDRYDFTVENKSRNYRSTLLQRMAFRANRRGEIVLNRFPRLRHALREIYLSVNEKSLGPSMGRPDEVLQRLRSFYAGENARLAEMLQKEYPTIKFPAWLDSSEAGASREIEHDMTPKVRGA